MSSALVKLSQVSRDDFEFAFAQWRPHLLGQKSSILLVHATGFHGRTWDLMANQLTEHHVVAPDLRGHGRSSKVAIDHWSVLSQDLTHLVDTLGIKSAIGVGHSVGGHVMIDAAARLPGVFNHLLLLDPVVGSPEFYSLAPKKVPENFLKPILQRKRDFQSVEEMMDRFRDRRPYSLFEEEILRDYCTHGLHKSGDGFTLACPPEIEASFYASNASNIEILDYARDVACPVTIVRAKSTEQADGFSFEGSPTWPELAGVFANSTDMQFKELSHFIPMQAPDLCLQLIDDIVLKSL